MRPRRVATGLLAGALLLAVLGLAAGRLGMRDRGIAHGDRGRPQVALTFDDGLNGETTLAVATLLEQRGTRGTFFIVGQTLETQADIARRLTERGHLLASHSPGHALARWADLRSAGVAQAQSMFAAHLGRCPAFYRPPHGKHTWWQAAAVRRAGMTLAGWDLTGWDWDETSADALTARVLREVQPGSIVLLHDGRDGRPDADRAVLLAALPAILDGLAARGLEAVTLDRMLGMPGTLDRC